MVAWVAAVGMGVAVAGGFGPRQLIAAHAMRAATPNDAAIAEAVLR
jgi:hypothetical protein